MVGMEPSVPPRPDERPSRFDWEGVDWTPLPTRRRRRGAALVATLVACALVAAAIAGGVTATKTIAPKGSSRDYKFLAVIGGERSSSSSIRAARGTAMSLRVRPVQVPKLARQRIPLIDLIADENSLFAGR